jgi:hypothetical protein
MKQRERILAKLSAVCVLLLGTTVMNFAWAAKTAPASHHSDRAASTRHGNPVTSRSAPAPAHATSAPTPVTSRSEHGEVGGATKSDWGPIDTRITVVNGPHSRPPAKTPDWKKSNIARPLGLPRDNHQVWKRSGEERAVKNAIGLPVHQPNASRNAPVVKSAIGSPVHQSNVGRDAPVVKSAIGLPVRQANASPSALGAAKKPVNTQLPTSINRSMINGTGMGRPGSGTVAIGGPNRKVAGVIDGTSLRPRHR